VKFKFGFQMEVDDGVVKGSQIVVDGTEWEEGTPEYPDGEGSAEGLSDDVINPIGVATFATDVTENDPIPFGFQAAKPGDTPGEYEPQLAPVIGPPSTWTGRVA